ncbi:MAG: hypothetical protein AVDCRST_MAG66-3769 [uncultured Pseudonocardia sp.]|uniref:Uncharacterized protein n=1 Tax=uncultured Pseudonocardia sp. TaxID=211455 RepID=A0A6J4QHI8_9PSEU|nr:MAG: hypothetical protein AVDCRST_MAG66-3769 [uncultured Pseudonocardia sp.]
MHSASDRTRRARLRAIAALGLVALPVVGSTFLLPTVAGAATAAVAPAADAGVVAATEDPDPLIDAPGSRLAESPAVESGARQRMGAVEPADDAAAREAFFAAGYSHEDAVALADLWRFDVEQAALRAGSLLAQDVALADSPYASVEAAEGLSDEELAALFLERYSVDDARVLAEQWGAPADVDLADVQARAGRELRGVGVLPFVEPAQSAVAVDDDATAVDDLVDDEAVAVGDEAAEAETEAAAAFTEAGYSDDDAEVLSQVWRTPDAYSAKVRAGGFLRDGIALADSPFATPEAASALNRDELAQLFTTSGYTAEDAEVLASLWGMDVADATVAAGVELKTVGVLPFVDVVLPDDAR